ncbi:hypothetical protein SLNWT_0122 [Streptomyces albus]|uniref:Uncharacterized protein n=1 Tax=Streptomyces albus (strain ATCC 21838 / DSM 41398 / FERM P-419 / JCM 4703 / NBRC 107858) TaxID=1081613 RepID=A0A0B5EEV8_STRA4|nr:hypothetical protein SLNWT_0122 [Streptomyces albus]AYN30628.1 hypothetical protein DUI70_0125 [Streptomyces albus]
MRHVKGRDGTGGRTRAHPAESKGNRRPRHTRSLPEKVSPPLPRLRADSAPLPPPRPEADTGRALPGRGNYPALSPTSPRLSLHGISYFTASVTSRCLLLQQPAPVTSNPIGRTVRAGAGFPCRGKAPRKASRESPRESRRPGRGGTPRPEGWRPCTSAPCGGLQAAPGRLPGDCGGSCCGWAVARCTEHRRGIAHSESVVGEWHAGPLTETVARQADLSGPRRSRGHYRLPVRKRPGIEREFPVMTVRVPLSCGIHAPAVRLRAAQAEIDVHSAPVSHLHQGGQLMTTGLSPATSSRTGFPLLAEETAQGRHIEPMESDFRSSFCRSGEFT